jgi:lipoyl(octanoyl) transferase
VSAPAGRPAGRRELEVRRLGTVPYAEALALQRALVDARKAGTVPDLLLLLQHPPVITLGTRGDGGRGNIVAAAPALAAMGMDVHEAGRGGDVTYHGPGQIVGYPILDLRPDRCDVHRYVRDIEEVMIRTCADYGIAASRIRGLTGTWVGGDKVGAIGIRISRWVTMHGFAFNVSPNLDHFAAIVPCGIADRGVTSLERLLGRAVPIAEVEAAIVRHFAEVFERAVLAPPSRPAGPPASTSGTRPTD